MEFETGKIGEPGNIAVGSTVRELEWGWGSGGFTWDN